MVIEVSKEIDVVRIGIDRYSLKTGCNLRTVMDLSLRVIKEPRGFIRIIQCVMAVLAFSTTAGFTTECKFKIFCEGEDEEVEYEFGYPFSDTGLSIPYSCEHRDRVSLTLPYDLSNASEFFVATGVISFLYTIIILVVYIFFHQTYANNTKIPIVDLGMTALLTVFWMGGSSAWAQGVADLKSYLHPETVFKFLIICMHKTDKDETNHCQTDEEGSFGLLNGSLILGFANFLLWTLSLWFIYKETVFHTPEVSDPSQNQSAKPVGRV